MKVNGRRLPDWAGADSALAGSAAFCAGGACGGAEGAQAATRATTAAMPATNRPMRVPCSNHLMAASPY